MSRSFITSLIHILALSDILKIFLVFSQATFNFFRAFLSALILSASALFSIFLRTISTKALSKSSPPRFVSPAVPKTSKLVELSFSSFFKDKIDTSKVPPPKSNINILLFKFFFSSNP